MSSTVQPSAKIKRRWTGAALIVLAMGIVAVFAFHGNSGTVDGSANADHCQDNREVGAEVGKMPWPVFDAAHYPPSVPASITGITYYVDGANGNNSNSGTTATAPLKTIARSLRLVAAGDTVLIKRGFYREGINLNGHASGTTGKPITFGSYGDGEVILDGSTKVGPWTQVDGTVWSAPIAFAPSAVVVNEVPLKQVTKPSKVTSCSGVWYVGGGYIIADMGTSSVGAGDPNHADIVVPNSVEDQAHVFFWGNYYTFKGLTIRGSGSNGIWGQGSHITVDSCVIKFNGKAAIAFQGAGDSDNVVLTSHIYHNVLANWPRGNNGYDQAGGGWPGTLTWFANLRPLARGNVVHMNGGEGIASYGTVNGVQSGHAIFEQNVVYDNWSVNIYFDNQANDTARNNFIFNHPPSAANFINGDTSLAKYSVCLMLADEYSSSDGTNNHANLAGTKVYNNIIAGCRIGIRDYSEKVATHGLKNVLLANNTIIMPRSSAPYGGNDIFGIYLRDNGRNSTNTTIVNNIIYGFVGDLIFSEAAGAIDGVTLNFNDYFSISGSSPLVAGIRLGKGKLTLWKSSGNETGINSTYADPLLLEPAAFSVPGTTPYDYRKAGPARISPTLSGGTIQSSFNTNFAGIPRIRWGVGAF